MSGKRHVWSDPLQPSSSSADSHLLLLKWNKFQCSNKSPSIFLRLIHQRCHFHHVESSPSPIGICYAYLTSKVCFARRRESAGSYFIHTSSSLQEETLRQFGLWRLMLWHRIGSNHFIFYPQYISLVQNHPRLLNATNFQGYESSYLRYERFIAYAQQSSAYDHFPGEVNEKAIFELLTQ